MCKKLCQNRSQLKDKIGRKRGSEGIKTGKLVVMTVVAITGLTGCVRIFDLERKKERVGKKKTGFSLADLFFALSGVCWLDLILSPVCLMLR